MNGCSEAANGFGSQLNVRQHTGTIIVVTSTDFKQVSLFVIVSNHVHDN